MKNTILYFNMKNIILSFLLLFSLGLFAQDPAPTIPPTVKLQTPNNVTFWTNPLDSSVWMFKGSYGWTKLADSARLHKDYVPYIGARKNVNIGTNTLTTDAIQFNLTPTNTIGQGTLQWNEVDQTLDLGVSGGLVTQQIGQELFVKVRNVTGVTIQEGKAVYVSGRTGQWPDVALAKGDSEATSMVLGIVTEDIANNSFGFVTTTGYVRRIKTDYSGWAEGDKLYLSKTVAGDLTDIEPSVPHHSDVIGSVGIVHGTLGSIFVSIDRHQTLEELTDVNGTALTETGQFPVWNNTAKYFDFDKNINGFKVFHGIFNRTQSTLSYVSATRTVSVTPTATNWRYYLEGKAYDKTTTTATHANTTGMHYLYYDSGNTLQFSTTPFNIMTDVLVATVYYNSTLATGILLDERHSHDRSREAHREFHEIIGAYKVSGFGIADYTLQPTTPTDANNTFSLTSGVIADEDIRHQLSALADAGPYKVFYKSGASGIWSWESNNVPYTWGATYIEWNQWTGATWQLTQATANNYLNMWVGKIGAVEGQYQTAIIVDQDEHAVAQDALDQKLGDMDFSGFPLPEFAVIYKVTFQTGAAYGTTGKCRIYAVTEEVKSFGGSGGGAAATTAHNSLIGIDGGEIGYYGHLNQIEKARIMNFRDSVRTNEKTNTAIFDNAIQSPTAKLTNLSDGFLPYHISDAAGLVNSPIYTDGTNVGIGTNLPSSNLHVLTNSGVGTSIILKLERDGGYGRTEINQFYNSIANYGLNINSNQFVIDKGAMNVGILTATPQSALDVNGTYSKSGVALFLDKFRTGYMGTSGQIPIAAGTTSDFVWTTPTTTHIAPSTDRKYVTDAEKTIISNTTASFTTAQETKLSGIEAGAEVNVNADWNSVSGDSQILNKPTLFTTANEIDPKFALDSAYLKSHVRTDLDKSITNELNNSMIWNDGTNTVSTVDAGGTKSVVITGFLESEVDGSTSNELNSSANWNNTTNEFSITDAGGSKAAIITGFLESEVDGSITNEIQDLSGSGSTLSGYQISLSSDASPVTLPNEADGSTTNELQTLNNTSDFNTHTVTLSNSGGSFKLAEGTNVTLSTSGTALDGIVTINASGGSGATDLSISGTSSPLTLNSSTGTDVTMTAGTGISLSGSSSNMTINNSSRMTYPSTLSGFAFYNGSGGWSSTLYNPDFSVNSGENYKMPTSGAVYSFVNTGYQQKLNGTGFVKANGTTITYDNTEYTPLTLAGRVSIDNGSTLGYLNSLDFTNTLGDVRLKLKTINSVAINGTGNFSLENYLGVPSVSGYVLSSTNSGTRSWIPLSGYTLPLTSNVTRGGLKIGYTNYLGTLALEIEGATEKAYVRLTKPAIEYEFTGDITSHNHDTHHALKTGVVTQAFSALNLSLPGSWLLKNDAGTFGLNNGSDRMTVDASGNVRAYDFITTSDRRLKRNIKPITYSNVGQIKFVQFTMKEDSSYRTRYGVIAQDVEKIMPELVHTDSNGIKAVSYIDLLVAKIVELENRIKALENEK